MPSAMLPGNGVSRATDRVRPPAQSTAETDKAKTINLIPFIKNLLTSEAAGLYHRSARCYRTASGNERMPHATFEEPEGYLRDGPAMPMRAKSATCRTVAVKEFAASDR